MQEQITSRDNPQIKHLAALLSQKKHREQTGQFAIEGMRLCMDALQSGLGVSTLFLTPQAAQRYPALLEKAHTANGVVWISPQLADKVADTKTPQGVFAILNGKDTPPDAVKVSPQGRYLLLAGIQDPGNLGTLLRTAQALGIDGALLAQCPELYSPKVVRASMGAVWRIPVAVWDTPDEMVAYVKECGVRTVAAALRQDAQPVREALLGEGCGLLIGNEGSGLPDALADACDQRIIIPMAGGADSLNAAGAAAILLWEMVR